MIQTKHQRFNNFSIINTDLIVFNILVYYEVGSPGDTVTLDISLVGSVLERKWNILATQIACADPWRFSFYTGYPKTMTIIDKCNFPKEFESLSQTLIF